jgi:hypothetical protein
MLGIDIDNVLSCKRRFTLARPRLKSLADGAKPHTCGSNSLTDQALLSQPGASKLGVRAKAWVCN